MADLAVWQRTIVDEEGNVIPGAEIEVRREEDDSLATLYADRAGETPLANPLAADMSGFVRFFAQGDAYTITAVGAGSTRTWRFDPTGRLQEFDRVSEALNADGGADIVSARSNLGTFSTVADVQNSHIPAVLESIRTLGAAGTEYRRKLVPEADLPGDIVSADGARWGLVHRDLSIGVFGAVGDGATDDTAAFTAAREFFEIVGGGTLRLQEDAVYLIDNWDLGSVKGLTIIANGSRFVERVGSSISDSFIRLGEDCSLDHLDYWLPAGLERFRVVTLFGERSSLWSWHVEAATQQANRSSNFHGAVRAMNAGCRLGSGLVVNFDSAYVLEGQGVQCERLEFRNYIRGVWLRQVSNYHVGAIIGRGASENSSDDDLLNGVLFTSTSLGYIGVIDVEDSGSHGTRFGDSNDGVNIQKYRSHNSGRCGLKFRSDEGLLNRNIWIGEVDVSDCGTGPEWGPNEEGVLVQRCENITFGSLKIYKVNKPFSSARGLRIDSTHWLTVLDADISDCDDDGIWVSNTDGQAPRAFGYFNIRARISNPGNSAVRMDYGGVTIRSINLDIEARNPAIHAIHIQNSGGDGSLSGPCNIRIASGARGGDLIHFDEPTNDALWNFDAIDSATSVVYKPLSTVSALQAFHSNVGGDYSRVAAIRYNGDLQNVNNAYGALSDLRLKDAVEASGSQWDDIKALQVRKFINRMNGEQQIGLVAQEVAQVSPGLVSYGDDDDTLCALKQSYPEASEEDLAALVAQGPIASLKYSVLNLKLLKVVQELQERVEALEGEGNG